jgi:hypothetical protein
MISAGFSFGSLHLLSQDRIFGLPRRGRSELIFTRFFEPALSFLLFDNKPAHLIPSKYQIFMSFC